MEQFFPIMLALLLMFMGIPVAISLLASSLYYFAFLTSGFTLDGLVQSLVSNTMGITKMAGPFFIIAGVIMNYSSITARLLSLCDGLVGHREGGLAYVNVILSTLNGGVCSAATADAALQCKILVPEMVKHGYPLSFSTVVTASSSLITPIIPPGASLIYYAILSGVSIGEMFFAGYIPGLMLCASMLITVTIFSKKFHWKSNRTKRATLKELSLALKDSIWSLVMPIVMIVGIRFGLFTATEGGVVMIALSMLVGLVFYKTISVRQLPRMFREAARSISGIMLLIISSIVFGMYLNWERIPQTISEMLMTVTTSPVVFILIVNVMLLIFGMFLDGTALLLIMTPLLAPVAQAFGVDLVAFGIIIIINIAMGSLTPPFGGVMYVTCSLTGCDLVDFMKQAWPFLIAMAVVLAILIIFPQIILFLPDLVF